MSSFDKVDSDDEFRDESSGIDVGLYEAPGSGGFHVFNVAPDHYHRAEALQRTGAIDITCNLEKVVHGAMSPDSDSYATLIVMKWLFQPKGTRRISKATITLEFSSESDESEIEVEHISFFDTYGLMPTTEDQSVTRGVEGTAGVEQVASLSVTGKFEKTVAKTTSHAITLSGAKHLVNNRPPNRIATWTLSENPSQRAGIPASLTVAVLVSRRDRATFFCNLSFTCETDWATAVQSVFKKIPKDDPIIFQPNPNLKGKRPNKKVLFGDDNLGSLDLDGFGDVTFRTIINNAEKARS